MLLLVGLGNPGKDYRLTRHNMGFMVVEEVARRFAVKWKNSSLYKSVLAEAAAESSVIFMLPQTMMNNSGLAVAKFAKDREINPGDILVLCDDFSIGFGELRARRQGSDGGHNGLKSIIAHLGRNDFGRLRLGIGPLPAGADPADFVLADFSKSEQKLLADFIQAAADCCETWINDGMDKVMNVFNKRKGNE